LLQIILLVIIYNLLFLFLIFSIKLYLTFLIIRVKDVVLVFRVIFYVFSFSGVFQRGLVIFGRCLRLEVVGFFVIVRRVRISLFRMGFDLIHQKYKDGFSLFLIRLFIIIMVKFSFKAMVQVIY
jgi:hypothetical protein